MNKRINKHHRRLTTLLGAITFLLLLTSCSNDALPVPPSFEQLGFQDALPVVQDQMAGAYQRWQTDPENAELNGSLAMMLSAYGKSAAAETWFERASELAPTEFRWVYYRAISALQLGRYEDAVLMLNDALAIDSNSLEARLQLADALLQINEFEQSITLYQSITTEHPDRVDAWLGLGKALDYRGDSTSAITALKRARTLGPEFGEVHYALAIALGANGDKEEAASELIAYEKNIHRKIDRSDRYTRSVIRLNASDGPLLAKADYQLSRSQFDQAVRFFNRALQINPANQDAWGGLVFAQAKRQDKDATAASYKAALEAGIEYKRLHFTYAQALREWQQLDRARDIMAKAIELDPQYTDALIAMGELELLRDNATAAVDHFRRAVAVIPNDRKVRLSLGQALNASEQFEQAVSELEPLIADAVTDQALTLRELAIAYHGLQRTDRAFTTLHQAHDAAANKYDVALKNDIAALLTKWQSEK